MENSNLEEQKYIRAKKRVKAIKGFYVHLTVYILVNAFLIATRVFTEGEFNNFWQWQTYNTAIFWGIGILFHAFNVFGMKFLLGKNWEEKKIKEIMDNDKRDLWE
ncbi:2TM domain-containing protein [Lutibacter maritimus]|jgi:hypothetical protein|uniref:2TM domain-containing protein n=1 Tax=Lutibacter maritimus TaxID=593133 RepID=A0A1I6NQP0_9FLAO|nr:2TM domain-containing protein [Lutibacter maritimus]SFS30200.1 2TM domain-containing protein [Lutibacter maritimus]